MIEAVQMYNIRAFYELKRCTGAGEGCTACHQELRQLLETYKQPEAEVSTASSLVWNGI